MTGAAQLAVSLLGPVLGGVATFYATRWVSRLDPFTHRFHERQLDATVEMMRKVSEIVSLIPWQRGGRASDEEKAAIRRWWRESYSLLMAHSLYLPNELMAKLWTVLSYFDDVTRTEPPEGNLGQAMWELTVEARKVTGIEALSPQLRGILPS